MFLLLNNNKIQLSLLCASSLREERVERKDQDRLEQKRASGTVKEFWLGLQSLNCSLPDSIAYIFITLYYNASS
jgi:hypothetical protein